MKSEKTVHQLTLESLKPTESVVGAEVKIAEIMAVIEQNGWVDHPAIAIKDKIDGTIYLLDGHHRLAAAQELELATIPVMILEFSEISRFYLYYNSIEEIRRAAKNVKRFR